MKIQIKYMVDRTPRGAPKYARHRIDSAEIRQRVEDLFTSDLKIRNVHIKKMEDKK